ncbi:hypothetical protein Barb6XT_02384 [Bacteroidales bacterium Barb6XT]|nr:hypothetical protein Barb6XT_02384 [Bacteroidales bacterium Barb6XT]
MKEKSITDRVKSYEDACAELGLEPARDEALTGVYLSKDELAYRKLKAIVKALNEGWEPEYSDEEWRYFLKAKRGEDGRVLARWCNSSYTYGGVACASADNDSSDTDASIGSRLAFKTRELARYAGKTFEALYADYLL